MNIDQTLLKLLQLQQVQQDAEKQIGNILGEFIKSISTVASNQSAMIADLQKRLTELENVNAPKKEPSAQV